MGTVCNAPIARDAIPEKTPIDPTNEENWIGMNIFKSCTKYSVDNKYEEKDAPETGDYVASVECMTILGKWDCGSFICARAAMLPTTVSESWYGIKRRLYCVQALPTLLEDTIAVRFSGTRGGEPVFRSTHDGSTWRMELGGDTDEWEDRVANTSFWCLDHWSWDANLNGEVGHELIPESSMFVTRALYLRCMHARVSNLHATDVGGVPLDTHPETPATPLTPQASAGPTTPVCPDAPKKKRRLSTIDHHTVKRRCDREWLKSMAARHAVQVEKELEMQLLERTGLHKRFCKAEVPGPIPKNDWVVEESEGDSSSDDSQKKKSEE